MTDQSGTHLGRQRSRLTATVTDFDVERQRALLIGVINDKSGVATGEQSLAELELLTDTAGSEPVESVLLNRDRFNAATLIGKGELADLVAESRALDIDVVVFDNELTPVQQHNLQQAFELGQGKTVDEIVAGMNVVAKGVKSTRGILASAEQVGRVLCEGPKRPMFYLDPYGKGCSIRDRVDQ